MKNTRISGLHRLPVRDRIGELERRGFLNRSDAAALRNGNPLLPIATADRMVENVIGVFGLPFGIASNFQVNGKDYLVPMVVEEPSIVAGLSRAALIVRASGGFQTTSTDPLLIGQVQVVGIADPDAAIRSLNKRAGDIVTQANSLQPRLINRGGGARQLEFFKYRLPDGDWTVVVHLLVDTGHAMGANIVNTMCESISPMIEEICGGTAVLRILSNLADKSMVRARAEFSLASLATDTYAAEFVRDGVVLANDYAMSDPHRAATHNKGIMNGIDALAIATGNDWRAIEASVHAFAGMGDGYRALTRWTVAANGDLHGELTLPLKVGIVGGSLQSNPGSKLGLEMTGVTTAAELAELMCAVGLAQNFAALNALVTSGIQEGHMRLHARSAAAAAGVDDTKFDAVVEQLQSGGSISATRASEIAREVSTANDAWPARTGVGTAHGKVILLGEHAVVYDRHALALPLANSVVARAAVEQNRRLSVPDWSIEHEWRPGDPPPVGAGQVIDRILQLLGLTDYGLRVHIDASIPIGKGLGSSAAFAVAVIRACNVLFDLEKTDVEIDRLAFQCEELVHGTPSGIDNNIATFGQPVIYSRSSQTRTRPVPIDGRPPLVIASCDQRGNTGQMVAGVRARRENNRALFDTLFDEIDELSIAGAAALADGDYAHLGLMMNVCHGLLNAIGVSTPALEQMVHVARSAGAAGAKLTGAGGGGSIVALCPGATVDVQDALKAAGFSIHAMDRDAV